MEGVITCDTASCLCVEVPPPHERKERQRSQEGGTEPRPQPRNQEDEAEQSSSTLHHRTSDTPTPRTGFALHICVLSIEASMAILVCSLHWSIKSQHDIGHWGYLSPGPRIPQGIFASTTPSCSLVIYIKLLPGQPGWVVSKGKLKTRTKQL